MIAPPPLKSPFKFLEAYTAQDKNRFFGREAEEQRLVELIFRSQLMLVYGQSGTGKSSLVQCGLAKMMAPADYFPVIIRRRANLPASIRATLGSLLDKPADSDVVSLVTQLSRYALRPVYLMFDQFEELFISGDRAEQTEFFDILKALYQSSASLKLLLVMREEYIAYLYPYEDLLPNLFDFRLRLEPMSEKNLHAVIVGTCRVAGIQLTDEGQTVKFIIDNNQSTRNQFQLPYLQVYLDRLWRTVMAGREASDTAPIVFDPPLVERVGKIEDVLAQFVDDQEQFISNQLAEADRPAVKSILEALVTYDGTRRECTAATLVTETGCPPALVSQIGTALEAARIVQVDGNTYELAHDSLAKVIDRGRSTEQRQINDILKRLKEAYQEYAANKNANDLLLSQRRLSEIGLYETTIRTELARTTPDGPAMQQFVTDSGTFLEQQRQAELAEQQRKNTRLRLTIAGISALLLLAVIAGVYAFIAREKAVNAEAEAKKQTQKAQASLNFVFLQKAKEAQSTGLRYNEYNEPQLAEKAFREASVLLTDSITYDEHHQPLFPKKEAVHDFDQLKQNLATQTRKSR